MTAIGNRVIWFSDAIEDGLHIRFWFEMQHSPLLMKRILTSFRSDAAVVVLSYRFVRSPMGYWYIFLTICNLFIRWKRTISSCTRNDKAAFVLWYIFYARLDILSFAQHEMVRYDSNGIIQYWNEQWNVNRAHRTGSTALDSGHPSHTQKWIGIIFQLGGTFADWSNYIQFKMKTYKFLVIVLVAVAGCLLVLLVV